MELGDTAAILEQTGREDGWEINERFARRCSFLAEWLC